MRDHSVRLPAAPPPARLLPSAGLFLLFCLVLSCLPPNTHPDTRARAGAIGVIGVLRPQVGIYRITAGGQVQRIEDWTVQGGNNLIAAAVTQLGRRRTRPVMIEPDTAASLVLDEMLPLYEAVSASIGRRSYGESPVLDRRPGRFDHSVGPLDDVLAPQEADALLVITAYDQISTFGRKALTAIGKITSLLFGEPPPEGATFLTMALLDRDGTVLWYGELEDRGGYDLRKRGSAAKAVRAVLETFPEAVR